MAITHLSELDVVQHNGTTKGLYLGGVLLEKTATQLNALTPAPTPGATIADITDTATGAEIATAVNAIIAALVAAGIIAAA